VPSLASTAEADADPPEARQGICLRRDLPNFAFDLNRGEQLQADREWQANFQRHREIFPDIDHRLPDVGPRDSHDILSGGDHLSDLRAHSGDDASEI